MKKQLTLFLTALLLCTNPLPVSAAGEMPAVRTILPRNLGDANSDGVCNSSDAAVLLISAANWGATGISGLTPAQEKALDVNADGSMDAIDGAWILRYAAYSGGGGTMSIVEYVHGYELD